MYITLESDYAVRIVSALSRSGKRLDAGTVSQQTAVTLRFSLKILRKLVAAGIVKSYKGAHGGYELSREPSQITLREVIEAIEGTYYFSRCLSPESECSRGAEDICPFRKVFGEISDMVRDKLESYTFADTEECSEHC